MKPTPSPELEAAARLVLGVGAGETDSETRMRFLRSLADHQFVPPAEAVEAAIALGIIAPMAAEFPHLERRVEADVAREVEAFADAYWTLSPEARSAEWNRLATLGRPFPRVNARLLSLEAGLAFEPGPMPGYVSHLQSQMLTVIVKGYPLQPAARSDRQREIDVDETIALRRAVNQMKGAVPDLTRIDHGWLGELAERRTSYKLQRGYLRPSKPKVSLFRLCFDWWIGSPRVILSTVILTGVFLSSILIRYVITNESEPKKAIYSSPAVKYPQIILSDIIAGFGKVASYPLKPEGLLAQSVIVARVIETPNMTPAKIQDAANEFIRMKTAYLMSKGDDHSKPDGVNAQKPSQSNSAKELLDRYPGLDAGQIALVEQLATRNDFSQAEVFASFVRLRNPRWIDTPGRTAPPLPPKP